MPVGGRPLVAHALEAFRRHPAVHEIILVVSPDAMPQARALIAGGPAHITEKVVLGGDTRRDSVWRGLQEVTAGTDMVLIHDAARPFVSQAVITRCLEAIARHGAAVVATPLADTVKRAAPEGYVDVTVDRRHLWGAQTPQGARLGLLMEAYARALAEDWAVTDDAGVLERVGHRVQLVEGESVNFKVTRPEDLALAERLLGGPRIGMGYDVHRLVEGRPLVLGGVTIPHTHGLAGHSDADVLTHAIMDALLGAAALGDIGRHFPDTDPTYKGADSLTLLAAVVAKLAALGLHPAHVDATLVAQAPKVAPYVDTMRERLASMLGLPLGRVSVKATTTEGLGFAGDGSGMAAYATVSVLG